MRIPLASQFYLHNNRQFSSQRLINQYVEVAPPDARTSAVLIATPGSTVFSDIGGKTRGLKVSDDLTTLYAVIGGTFYTIDTAGTATAIGAIDGTDYVDIITNATQVMIAAGATSYFYTIATGVLAQITDGDFPGASAAIYMDGYGIVAVPNSTQSNVSDIGDFSAWDALDFTNETTSPDDIVTIRDDKKEFWIFKSKTIVPYTRTGSGTYPFDRIGQAILSMGCVAKWSVATADNSFFWLGNREEEGGYAVYRAAGYSPVRISTHAIEQKIETLQRPENAIAFTYMLGGHIFYVLNFVDQATFVYDASTGLWHEWNRYDEEWSTYTHHAFFNGQHIAASVYGVLYTLSSSVYTDAGQPIQRKMITPVYSSDGSAINVKMVEIELEAGVGLTTGQGSAPQIMLRFSKTAGRTWSNEYWRDVGAIGQYGTRAIWRNLGRSREWVLEITYSEPTQYSVFSAYALPSVGAV